MQGFLVALFRSVDRLDAFAGIGLFFGERFSFSDLLWGGFFIEEASSAWLT
jgi:hypothetical protein